MTITCVLDNVQCCYELLSQQYTELNIYTSLSLWKVWRNIMGRKHVM